MSVTPSGMAEANRSTSPRYDGAVRRQVNGVDVAVAPVAREQGLLVLAAETSSRRRTSCPVGEPGPASTTAGSVSG